ncbi:MAG: tetratricopeptide repeat protein [Planctomycetes bacterium]|nr:tetratricopeptide repeat protein [Planctomycetota bacterium]
MLSCKKCAKINVKLLIILIFFTVSIAVSLFAVRQVRRKILSKMSLQAGNVAFENEDWVAAYKNFREYLGRNPNDIDILKKYANACFFVRPINANTIKRTITAYRQVMRLDPQEETAYDKLAMLYVVIGNYEDLAHIARTRIQLDPNEPNPQAQLWLGEALKGLNKTEDAKAELQKSIDILYDLRPEKHPEYIRACILMSQIILEDDSFDAEKLALKWLTDAVKYDPNSIEALATRAWFYRQTPDIPDVNEPGTLMSEEERLRRAQEDLVRADIAGTDNPRFRLFLAGEWMAHDQWDRAAYELKAAENLPLEKIQEYFLDLNEWAVARFQLAAKLAIQKNDFDEGISRADETLEELEDKRYRVLILPLAIRLYINDPNKIQDANECMDEYVNILRTNEGLSGSRQDRIYLKALLAKAKNDSYAVIDILQPAVINDDSRPDFWGLLAEAFSRTDQPRRAVTALFKYLRLRNQDVEMTLLLAKEYIKLQDWNKAFETAKLANEMDPTRIVPNLLRIEASINIVTEQSEINEDELQSLAEDLAELREEYPDRVDIRILQAIIAEYLDSPEEAEEELKDAIEECNEPLDAKIQLVRFYHRAKRITDANSIGQAACEDHSEVAKPWLAMFRLYMAEADYDSARLCLETAQKKVTDKWDKRAISINLAMLEFQDGDSIKGRALLSEVASQDDREIRARTLLLTIPEVREDQKQASELISGLREAEGETGLMWRLYQAQVWLESDQWRSKQVEIADLLQYCIDSDPQWSSPPLLLAEMYNKLQDFRHIEDTYRQALIRNPSAIDIADKLVTLLEQQGRFADAETVLQQSETNSRFTSSRHIIWALRAGQPSQAIDELKVRIATDDQDANSRIILARIIFLQDKNNAGEALEYLNEAEAIDPNTLVLTAARVSILKAIGKTEDAQRILNDYVTNKKTFDAYMIRGEYFANEGEYELAEKDYEKLKTFSKQGAIGYELLSNFYLMNEKYDKAVEVIEEGSNKYQENLRLKRGLMKILFLQSPVQDQDRALEILSELEQKELSPDPELMYYRARHILSESTPQSLETARGIFENAIKLEPTAVDAHLLLIGIMMEQGDYEAARDPDRATQIYKTARDRAIQAIGSNPNNMALLLARSRTEIKLENTQIAVQLVRVVLQKNPNNSEARDVFSLAAIRSEWPDLLEEAVTLIESASDDNPINEKQMLLQASENVNQPEIIIPLLEAYCKTKKGRDSVDAIVTLADLYRLSDNMDTAKQWIEQAEKKDPNNQVVVHARFLWLVAQKRFEELADISSKYISAKEQNPQTLMNAASILVGLDSITLKKEGSKLYEHIKAISPTSITERLNVATALYQKGDAEQAEQIYRELLEQYPDNIRILNDLAWILQDHYHRYADALELANKGLSLAPNHLNLLDTRGTILSNLPGRLADAKADFEKLTSASPPDSPQRAMKLLQLGRICVKLNDLKQARQHMEKALEIDRKIDIDIFTSDERSEIAKFLQ